MNACRRDFLKKVGLGVGAVVVCGFSSSVEAVESKGLPRSPPEAQGVRSDKILAFLDAVAASQHEFHSLMVLRHGHVIAEGWWKPYRPESPQMLYSLSKSFTSTAIGLAVAEGRLSVEDKVLKFFPDKAPDSVSEHLAALRVRDLLSMSVGHAEDSTGTLWGKDDWVKQFLSLPIKNPPGSVFSYNSGATFMCSAIVQKVTAHNVNDYLGPRLFEPLGIEKVSWEVCPQGINTGGWGLKLPTEALAKFGQLYLQKGMWNGQQILSPAWVEEATSFKIQQPAPDLDKARRDSDWHQGYCYQFWRSRHNAYRGDGAFGQYTVVLPEKDAVVVITSESSSMQGEMNLIWDYLLPAMTDEAQPSTPKDWRALKERLASLEVPPVKGQGTSPRKSTISNRAYLVDTNDHRIETCRWTFDRDKVRFTLSDSQGLHNIDCGLGHWKDGETSMPEMPPKLTRGDLGPVSKVAASAAWLNPETLQMRWQFYETPHHATVTCRFADSGAALELELLDSLAKMGNKQPKWKLKATAQVSKS